MGLVIFANGCVNKFTDTEIEFNPEVLDEVLEQEMSKLDMTQQETTTTALNMADDICHSQMMTPTRNYVLQLPHITQTSPTEDAESSLETKPRKDLAEPLETMEQQHDASSRKSSSSRSSAKRRKDTGVGPTA